MQSSFFHTSYRIFILGLQNFVRNAWLSAAATLVIIVAIAFVLGGIVLNVLSKNVISNLPEHFKISVYLQPDISEDDLSRLRHDLATHSNVAEVEYVSSAAAYERFESDFGEDEDIQTALSLLGSDSKVFPAALEISVLDLNLIQDVSRMAEQERYGGLVESVSLGKVDAQTAIERATWIQNNVVKISLISALVFGTIAFLIIFNTIRMAIFARREEIQIMRLIGAPHYFIRNPFLVEAGLFGIIAGSIAVGLIYGALVFFIDPQTSATEIVESYDYFVRPGIILLMLAGAILGSIAISFLSCWVALQRYLKI